MQKQQLTNEQILAIKCALADLEGSHQACAHENNTHDWDGQEKTILDLRTAFAEILTD